MHTITYESLNADFAKFQHKVIDENEALLVTSEFGNTVLLSEKDWKDMQETLNLIRDKTSFAALVESHRNRKDGTPNESYSISEVFDDL